MPTKGGSQAPQDPPSYAPVVVKPKKRVTIHKTNIFSCCTQFNDVFSRCRFHSQLTDLGNVFSENIEESDKTKFRLK